MTQQEKHESLSSRALDALLSEDSPETDAVKSAFEEAKIHRTVFWRYRNGLGKPSAETAAKIERITSGRVPANGWESLPSTEPTGEAKAAS